MRTIISLILLAAVVVTPQDWSNLVSRVTALERKDAQREDARKKRLEEQKKKADTRKTQIQQAREKYRLHRVPASGKKGASK